MSPKQGAMLCRATSYTLPTAKNCLLLPTACCLLHTCTLVAGEPAVGAARADVRHRPVAGLEVHVQPAADDLEKGMERVEMAETGSNGSMCWMRTTRCVRSSGRKPAVRPRAKGGQPFRVLRFRANLEQDLVAVAVGPQRRRQRRRAFQVGLHSAHLAQVTALTERLARIWSITVRELCGIRESGRAHEQRGCVATAVDDSLANCLTAGCAHPKP